jgi:PIN domain nuclease of toxin-antitoxin system
LKKLTLSQPYRPWIEKAIADLGASLLPIAIEHADALVGLPMHHRDPFDRLLVAQSMIEKLLVVGADGQLDAYGITRLWWGPQRAMASPGAPPQPDDRPDARRKQTDRGQR